MFLSYMPVKQKLNSILILLIYYFELLPNISDIYMFDVKY